MKNKYHLIKNDNNNNYTEDKIIKSGKIVELDELTINYSNTKDLIIISDNNLINYKNNKIEPWKEKVLSIEDKKFFDTYTSNNIESKTKYTNSLIKAYIDYLLKKITEIKKHPIIHMIKNSNLGDDFNPKKLTEQEIITLVNKFYEKTSYKRLRDLYILLKTNKALYKEHMYTTDGKNINENNKYYLYLKDYRYSEDKNNFFKDKKLVLESLLETIDSFTIKYNDTQEIANNTVKDNEQLLLVGEGTIISGTTKNILERKINRKPIYYEVLTNKDKDFYQITHSTDRRKKEYFEELRKQYFTCLYYDEESLQEFIDYYKKELDLKEGIDYQKILLLLNNKTNTYNYRMARYMYMEIKKSKERERIKRYERNRKLP